MTKLILFLAALTLSLSSHAATTGSVDLVAEAPTSQAVTASTIATNVSNLGLAAQTDVTFGEVVIDSNSVNGFRLSFSSLNSGKLVALDNGGAFVSTPAATQQIDYTFKLTSPTSGTLGAGLSNATNLGSATNLGVGAANYDFIGSASSVTSALTFGMQFSTATKTLMGGLYKDIITVEISSL